MSEDEVDFRGFVAARSGALLRTAFLLTGDWQRAEDLLQAALMRCYGRWARIESPEAYVRQVMVTLVTGWRHRRWNAEVPTEVLPDPSPVQDPSVRWEERLDMLRLLRELAPRQRAVVVLRFYEDMTEVQVAQMLGITLGTVKSQTARALARLRDSPWLQLSGQERQE